MSKPPVVLPGIDAGQDFPDQPANGPMRPWHELFHTVYQRDIDNKLKDLGSLNTPVLIRLADELILFHGGHKHSRIVADESYHRLKTLCHIPLALYLFLTQQAQMDEQTMNAIQASLTALANASEDQGLIKSSERFLAEYRELGLVSDAAQRRFQTQYNRAARLLIQRASNEAVAAMDEAIRDLESQVADPTQWSELYCVVCSGHQPRYGELNKQFFEQYLQDRNIGDARWEHRLLYGEGITDAHAALRLVAQRRVDEKLGTSFLGSAVGLNQDILAHAGRVALRRSRD